VKTISGKLSSLGQNGVAWGRMGSIGLVEAFLMGLNIECAIPFITVTKSKGYWQGVKSIAFG